MDTNKFNYCGLASIEDTFNFLEIFKELEFAQDDFLSKQHLFRSKEYKWPTDALHSWSRIVEYPYVIFHLKEFLKIRNKNIDILDFGSGVTFFPFEVAKLGAKVTCIDISPVVKNDIEEAKKILGMSDQNITCILNPDPVLMLPDSSQDIIYSISVIEHMDSVDVIAAEFARLLKSDGRLILTFDLDLRGDRQIQPKEYEILKKTLSSYFEPCFENRLIHPVTMLTSVNSPYPLTSGWRYRLSNYLKNIVRPMVGKNKVMYPSYMLACELLVLKKKVIDL